MTYTVRDYDPGDSRDAERLATMFNGFDSVWPGGFTRGLPETAESVRARASSMRRLATCVVAHGDEIVGFCILKEREGSPGVTYIPLLGASPEHHGKGVGKMLLLEMVRRATVAGYRIITLGTWPANTKAVPLYKKTGFHWVPETTVRMRNYIPAVLMLPAAAAFFENRNWYDFLVRDLTVAPDDVTWHGMKVYPYRFRDGQAFLNIMFDAVSDGVTAIETPEWSAACYVAAEEVPAGEAVPITWEIDTGTGGARDVTLLVDGDTDLNIAFQETLRIEGHTTLTRVVQVSPSAMPPREGHPSHRVRSTILVGGSATMFETGVKVVRPIEIKFDGCALLPGRPESITFQLRNRLHRDVHGSLAMDRSPDLAVAPPSAPFTIPSCGWTDCAFVVTASRAGALATTLRLEAGAASAARHVAFRALGAGPVATIEAVDSELAILENAELRARIEIRGGSLEIQHTVLDHQVARLRMPAPGPPYVDRRDRPPLLATTITHRDDGDSIITAQPSVEFPGITVERTVSILTGGVARVSYRVLNTGESPLSTHLRFQPDYFFYPSYVTFSTPTGLVREPLRGACDFPTGNADICPRGSTLTENWTAVEEDDFVAGLVWAGAPEMETDWESSPHLIYDTGEIPPHDSVELPPAYVIGSPGDWSVVRAWWRRLVQQSGIREIEKPSPGRVLEARTDPEPLLLRDDASTVQVELLSRRGKRISGRATLAGTGFGIVEAAHPFEDLDREKSVRVTTIVSAPAEPAAGYICATVDTGPTAETFRLPAARIESPGSIETTTLPDGRYSVGNGFLTMVAAPRFRGSLTAIEIGGVNQLFSAFPEPRPFQWMNPWFGGIYPCLMSWSADPLLAAESFHGEPVVRRGARGFEWKGVRTWCDLAHRDWSWLRVETEYLTLSNSCAIAVQTRWINKSSARMRVDAGVMAYLQPGGERDNVIAHWDCEGERRTRTRGGFPVHLQSSGIAAVTNPDAGWTTLLASTNRLQRPVLEDIGADGVHIALPLHLDIAPSSTEERLCWLVFCRSSGVIDAWTDALRGASSLP